MYSVLFAIRFSRPLGTNYSQPLLYRMAKTSTYLYGIVSKVSGIAKFTQTLQERHPQVAASGALSVCWRNSCNARSTRNRETQRKRCTVDV